MVCSQAAWAQDASPAVALNGLGSRTVFVLDESGHELRGTVVAIGTDTVTFHRGGISERLPLAAIRRVERLGDSPWDGAAVGAGIAASVSAAMWLFEASCRLEPTCEFDRQEEHLMLGEAAAMAVAFTAIGFAIDVLHVGRTAIWIAPTAAPASPRGGSGRLAAKRTTPAVMVGYRLGF
jgi:hypothetical protein